MPKLTTPTITLLLIAITILSCKDKSKNDEKVITALENSLISSNHTINISTETLLKDLEDKTQDPCTKERADVWFAKAATIANKSKTLYDLLDSTKSKKDIDNPELTLIADNIKKFRDEVLSLHTELQEIFGGSFQFIPAFISAIGGDTLQKDESFTKTSISSKRATLSMLQNEVKKIENKTIAFCHTKVPSCGGWFDTYSVIVGQNSNYLKPGSKLEIMAGVGAFSKASQPVITINTTNIELGPEGFSSYKTTAPKIPGNYKIPVRIKYHDPTTGKDEDRFVNVEYTVAKACDQ